MDFGGNKKRLRRSPGLSSAVALLWGLTTTPLLVPFPTRAAETVPWAEECQNSPSNWRQKTGIEALCVRRVLDLHVNDGNYWIGRWFWRTSDRAEIPIELTGFRPNWEPWSLKPLLEVHWTESPLGALVHIVTQSGSPSTSDPLILPYHLVRKVSLSGKAELVWESNFPFRLIREPAPDPETGETAFRILNPNARELEFKTLPRLSAQGKVLSPWVSAQGAMKLAFRLHDALDPLPGLPALSSITEYEATETRELWTADSDSRTLSTTALSTQLGQALDADLQRPVWITGHHRGASFFGTGIVISSSGEVVTAAHVVREMDSSSIRVSLRGGWDDPQDWLERPERPNIEFPARVIGMDPFTDLAVLQVIAPPAPSERTSETLFRIYRRDVGVYPLYARFNPFDAVTVPSFSAFLGHDVHEFDRDRPHSIFLFDDPETGARPLLLPAVVDHELPGGIWKLRHTGLQRGNSGSPLIRVGNGWIGLVFKKFFTRPGEIEEINAIAESQERLRRFRDYERRLRDEAKLPALATLLTPDHYRIIQDLRNLGRVRPENSLALALQSTYVNYERIDAPLFETKGAVFTLLPTRNWAYLLSQEASLADFIGGSSETPGGIGGGSSSPRPPIDDFPEQKRFLEGLSESPLPGGLHRQALLCLRTPGWKPLRLGGVTIEPGTILRAPTRFEELENAITRGQLERLFPERTPMLSSGMKR